MKNAVVIDAVRTPVGRASADKGYFRDVRSEDLSAHVMQALLKRTGIDPKRDRGRALGLRACSKANRASTSPASRRWSPACPRRPAA